MYYSELLEILSKLFNVKYSGQHKGAKDSTLRIQWLCARICHTHKKTLYFRSVHVNLTDTESLTFLS